MLLALLNALVVRVVDPTAKVLDIPKAICDVVSYVLDAMDDITGLATAGDISTNLSLIGREH